MNVRIYTAAQSLMTFCNNDKTKRIRDPSSAKSPDFEAVKQIPKHDQTSNYNNPNFIYFPHQLQKLRTHEIQSRSRVEL